MKCPYCGNDVDNNALTCPYCRNSLNFNQTLNLNPISDANQGASNFMQPQVIQQPAVTNSQVQTQQVSDVTLGQPNVVQSNVPFQNNVAQPAQVVQQTVQVVPTSQVITNENQTASPSMQVANNNQLVGSPPVQVVTHNMNNASPPVQVVTHTANQPTQVVVHQPSSAGPPTQVVVQKKVIATHPTVNQGVVQTNIGMSQIQTSNVVNNRPTIQNDNVVSNLELTNTNLELTNTNIIPVTSENNTSESVDENTKGDVFFKTLVIFIAFSLVVIIVILLVYMIPKLSSKTIKDDDSNKTTENTTTTVPAPSSNNSGVTRNKFNRATVGEVSLSSYRDEESKKTTIVDVVLDRYIYGDELKSLVSEYGQNYETINSFNWYGLEYTVRFNDLDYLNGRKVDPKLGGQIYDYMGNPFIMIPADNTYFPKVLEIYNGSGISNGETAIIKAIYQLPSDHDATVCFGEQTNVQTCFHKNG